MHKYFHKLATFTALVLISSIPFQAEVFADPEKKPKPVTAASAGNNASTTKHESQED